MIQTALRKISLAALSVLITTGAVWAQAPAPQVPMAGDIVSYEGGKMVVKLKDGSTINVNIPDTIGVSALQAIPFADLKKGDYIATAAIKQPNGTLRAREVRIFPPESRGVGEGHRPYPGEGGANSTMTNATVDTVDSMDAKTRSFKVKYKDGEQTVVIPDNVPLLRTIPGNKALLVPGAGVTLSVSETPNGLTAARLGVGLNGVKPAV